MKKISIIILLSLISCDIKNTPECSDEKVKEKVVKILQEKLRQKLIRNYSNANFVITRALPTSASPDDYFFTDEEYKEADSYSQKVLNELKLTNIITTHLADSIKKCSCKSHIEIKYLDKLNVKYTAQFTDDGKPYVKIDVIEEE